MIKSERFINLGRVLEDMIKNKEQVQDSIKGAIIGCACGDAYGMPYEGLTKEQITTFHGKKISEKYIDSEYSRHTKGLKRGSYTDDTQLTLATVESILEKEDVDVEDIGRRFAELYKHKKLIGAGRSTKFALKNITKGASAYESGLEDAYGCGAAMRISPLAAISAEGHYKSIIVNHVASITHNNKIGFQSAYLLGGAIKTVMFDDDYLDKELLKSNFKNIPKLNRFDFEPKKYSLIKKIHDNLDHIDEPIDVLAEKIGVSGLANESVVYALFCFVKEPHDFKKLMNYSVRNGGDTDSIASMTGTLYGALQGFSKIPKSYVINLKDTHKIQKLSEEYATYSVDKLFR